MNSPNQPPRLKLSKNLTNPSKSWSGSGLSLQKIQRCLPIFVCDLSPKQQCFTPHFYRLQWLFRLLGTTVMNQLLRYTISFLTRQLPHSKNRKSERSYAFDIILPESASQEETYNNTVKELLEDIMRGYNATVFAYGATGAGKTYTYCQRLTQNRMLGTPSEPGLMFRTVAHMLDTIAAESNAYFTIHLSYLEVYNENIKDLLAENDIGVHELREDPQKGVVINGLKEVTVTDPDDIMNTLSIGDQKRTKEKTLANEVSSRSHAVMILVVDSKNAMTGDMNAAKLILVDLAGSERAAFTQNKGLRMVEEANINRSLLSLGNCINALAEQAKNGIKAPTYVPYRDSKLTRLLKNSLGGNCRTVMIAAVNPSSVCYEDTLQTLKYADRARTIRNVVKANIIKKEERVTHYANQIANIKKQIKALSGSGTSLPYVNPPYENRSPKQASKKPIRKYTLEKEDVTPVQQGESKIQQLQGKIRECFENEMHAKTKLYALDESLENIGFELFSKQLLFAKLAKTETESRELDRLNKEISSLTTQLSNAKKNRAKIVETLELIESEREKYTIEANRELLKAPTSTASAIKYIIDNYALNLKNADSTRKANHANFKVRQRESYIRHLKEELSIRDKLIRERIKSRQPAILDEDENESKMRQYETGTEIELPRVKRASENAKSSITVAAAAGVRQAANLTPIPPRDPSINNQNIHKLVIKSRNNIINPLKLYARVAERSLKHYNKLQDESVRSYLNHSVLNDYSGLDTGSQKVVLSNKARKYMARIGKLSVDSRRKPRPAPSHSFAASISLPNKQCNIIPICIRYTIFLLYIINTYNSHKQLSLSL
eukprot:TRINITY_DN72143_c0_g1_i1.p1 TRINITY_DN72143_c0_g1~~TRINITY_DN72143_c0_g1_i1.p1  ORF type:complete len:836 (-),score=45.37 TRINITY_DN72143_c0_g1_i1:1378-3885(-)